MPNDVFILNALEVMTKEVQWGIKTYLVFVRSRERKYLDIQDEKPTVVINLRTYSLVPK